MTHLKVVIPAAGRGTRFLPITKAMPKEMLPVLNRPVIQYVVEEAVAAGADEVIIVTGPGKRAIADHFDITSVSDAPDRDGVLQALTEMASRVPIRFVTQGTVSGLGGAILSAQPSTGQDPFAVLLGDSVHLCAPPLLTQLNEVFEEHGKRSCVVALEQVAAERVSWYGIAVGTALSNGVIKVEDFVEKPRPGEVSSRLAITGAYCLTQRIFDALRRTPPDGAGEVQVTDALRRLAREEEVLGVLFHGKRYDTGNPAAWLETNLALAWQDPRYRPTIEAFFEQKVPNARSEARVPRPAS